MWWQYFMYKITYKQCWHVMYTLRQNVIWIFWYMATCIIIIYISSTDAANITTHQIWACHIDNIYISCDTYKYYLCPYLTYCDRYWQHLHLKHKLLPYMLLYIKYSYLNVYITYPHCLYVILYMKYCHQRVPYISEIPALFYLSLW